MSAELKGLLDKTTTECGEFDDGSSAINGRNMALKEPLIFEFREQM